MQTMRYTDKLVVLFTLLCNSKQNFSEAEKMTKITAVNRNILNAIKQPLELLTTKCHSEAPSAEDLGIHTGENTPVLSKKLATTQELASPAENSVKQKSLMEFLES